MQIQITGRHLEITPALKSYIEEKIGKLTNHFDNIISAQVVLSIAREKQIAEAKIIVPGNEFVAKADGINMYAAIDKLEDKLDRQVRKHKQKLKSHHVVKDKYDHEIEGSDESEEIEGKDKIASE